MASRARPTTKKALGDWELMKAKFALGPKAVVGCLRAGLSLHGRKFADRAKKIYKTKKQNPLVVSWSEQSLTLNVIMMILSYSSNISIYIAA